MTFTGFMGRWHGGLSGPMKEKHLRNEIARHTAQLAEWREKRVECALAIKNHRLALAKLTRAAIRLGITL